MKHLTKSTLIKYLLASLIMLMAQSCLPDSYIKEEGMIWNTTFHITYKGAPELKDSILAVLNDVGKSLNVFDENSLVSKLNSGDSILADHHLLKVYSESRIINEASKGLFDPTLSPLISAWGFGPGHTASADPTAIDSILSFVGISKTSLSGKYIVKNDRRTQFNFSAIAKGYGCDQVAEMLIRNGVKDYLVEIGGEIATGGRGPKGRLWKISIDKPIETDSSERHDSQTIIEVTNAGIATSGNYRNFRKENGSKFGHTLSPVTGRPVATDVASATIIAPSAMEADAVATACLAAGSVKAKEILRTLELEGLLIMADSTYWTSPGFENLIVK